MSAQRLRDAAEVLRELAGATEPGPWEVRRGGLIARASTSPRLVWPSHASADGQYWEDQRERNYATAAFIATMHPGVALALAQVLESLAFDREVNDEIDGRTWSELLAVADLILGAE